MKLNKFEIDNLIKDNILLKERVKELKLENKEITKQLTIPDVVHCFGKDDLQYVYEDVDTQFKSFEHWYEEYILPI
mgnify:CR=1 FL=1|tara:strand:- start:63 stop:290 length:228 start_codon:yes stop_codon:yes gene_type:complete